MCGGGFSPPAETAAQKADRLAREQAIEAQKMEAQQEREKDKAARLQDAVARGSGMYGARSLISAGRGASGIGRGMLG